jgi:hypothetical protein
MAYTDPHLDKPETDNEDPMRLIERRDMTLPKFRKSNMDVLDPNLTDPRTDRALPSSQVPNTLTLVTLPTREAPNTEIPLPIRTALRMERLLPKFIKSKIEPVVPARNTHRIDKLDPTTA